jgi:D-cysteine desulfhydrase
MTADRPLYTRYPALRTKLPSLTLGDFPTPLDEAAQLAATLSIGSLHIKRDDLSAQDYGGNKIRKLEFLLAHAQEQKCGHIITYGGFGSNHALATSINCRRLGLKCAAILTPEPVTENVRRTLAYHVLLGTDLALARGYPEISAITQQLKASLGAASCYEIPFGGSSWRGAVGFVDAAFELADQITAGDFLAPDVIYLACGTAGSIAGLSLGLRLAGISNCRIEAVQVTPDSMRPAQLAASLFTELNARLHELDNELPLLEDALRKINVRNDQLGDGYAMPTDAAREALKIAEESTGLPVSLTYTAKVIAGMIKDARNGALKNTNVLLWNTYNSRPYPAMDVDTLLAQLPDELRDAL